MIDTGVGPLKPCGASAIPNLDLLENIARITWGVMTDLLTIGMEVPSLRSNVGIDAIVFAMISICFRKGKIYCRMMKGVSG